MTITFEELLDRWNTDEGKPYKGKLIDMAAYAKNHGNPGCMCAQGQVLHSLGGWSVEQLANAEQNSADEATASLLNISLAHAILLRQINDNADGAPAIVLTDPGKVLGDQWSKLLDFWAYLDGMTYAAYDAARAAAWAASGAAAGAAARVSAYDAARAAAYYAAGDAYEIQGAEILRRNGKAFFFLPAFGFASLDDIPARPSNYGIPAGAS